MSLDGLTVLTHSMITSQRINESLRNNQTVLQCHKVHRTFPNRESDSEESEFVYNLQEMLCIESS